MFLFDPCLPHAVGLFPGGRLELPSDRWIGKSSCAGVQLYLSGEVTLNSDQWAAIGCPWHQPPFRQRRSVLDLASANIDKGTGAPTPRGNGSLTDES